VSVCVSVCLCVWFLGVCVFFFVWMWCIIMSISPTRVYVYSSRYIVIYNNVMGLLASLYSPRSSFNIDICPQRRKVYIWCKCHCTSTQLGIFASVVLAACNDLHCLNMNVWNHAKGRCTNQEQIIKIWEPLKCLHLVTSLHLLKDLFQYNYGKLLCD